VQRRTVGGRAPLALLTALAVAVLAACAVAAGAPAATPAPAEIREANPGAYPNRAYILTLPRRQNITTSDVTVTENGEPVDGLSVVPAGEQPGTSATMLVLDASNSMRGGPIANAMEAARAFVQRKPRFARIGIVTFNGKVSLLLPPTDDRAVILAALRRTPELREGTHIFDGIAAAAEQLRVAGVTVPTIVVLSDGNDVGSATTQEQALAAATAGRARIFSVGLRSGQFDPQVLQALAAGSSGAYAEADSPGDLQPLFEDIGFRLGNEYLVLYRSLEKPESKVTVSVSARGFSPATAAYTTPALPETVAASKSGWDKFVQSPLALIGLVVLLVALVGYAISQVLSMRKVSFTTRMAGFVDLTSEELEKRAAERRSDVRALLADADKTLGRRRYFRDFADDCALADIEVSPAALALFSIVGGVLLGILLAVGFGSPFAFLLGLIVPLGVRGLVSARVDRKRRRFGEQLPDNLDIMAQSLRAGHSLVGSIAVVGQSAAEPSATEFSRVARDEQLGVPLEDALGSAVQRMDSQDLDQVALVAVLQRDAGSNAAEVIDQVARNIRTRMELRRLARTLTAQGRMARWILTLLPVGVFLMLLLISRDYLSPLWETGRGIAALIVTGLMVALGSRIIKKIVDIKV
jgi:tight adherence protein B